MSAPPSNDVEDRGGGRWWIRTATDADGRQVGGGAFIDGGEERVVNFLGGEVEDVFGFCEEVTLNFPPL